MSKTKTIISGIALGVVAYLVASKLLKPKPFMKVKSGMSGADGKSYGNGIGFADADGMEDMEGSSSADGNYGNGIGFADANGMEDMSSANGKSYGNGLSFEDANGIDEVQGEFYTEKDDFYAANGDFYDADGTYYGSAGDFMSMDGTYYGADGVDETDGMAKANEVVDTKNKLSDQKPKKRKHKSLAHWKKRVETLVKAYSTAVDGGNTPEPEIQKISDKLAKARKMVASLESKSI